MRVRSQLLALELFFISNHHIRHGGLLDGDCRELGMSTGDDGPANAVETLALTPRETVLEYEPGKNQHQNRRDPAPRAAIQAPGRRKDLAAGTTGPKAWDPGGETSREAAREAAARAQEC